MRRLWRQDKQNARLGSHARSALPVEKWLSLALLCVVSAAVLRPLPARAQPKPTEYQVKAACFFYFAKFVEWPASAFAGESSPFVFAILGEDPFGEILDKTLNGKTVNQRSVKVVRYKKLEEVGRCHLLFVSSTLQDRLPKVFRALEGTPVATVGESDGFARQGGVFNFFLKEGSVNFEVNLEAAARAGLTVSSKLIQLGVLVKDEPEWRKT